MYAPTNAGGTVTAIAVNGPSTTTPNKKKTKKASGAPSAQKTSLAFRWADSLLKGAFGEFSTEIHSNGAQMVYRWNNAYWQEVNEAEGHAMVARWLTVVDPQSAKAGAAKDAWAFGAMRLFDAKRKPEATSDFVIPCLNAYLRITDDATIHVEAPDKALGLTHATKVTVATPVGQTHTPKPMPEDCLLARFLNRSLPDKEVQAFVQELSAMSFIPRNYGMVGTFFGPPSAGKSTFVNILSAFHARPACVSLHKLDDGFGLEQIIDSTFIQVDEVETKKWCEATFKSLATGDPITINRKHRTPIAAYRNRAMIFMTSNHSPFVTDNSGGVYRRMAPVHWNVTVPEAERIIDLHKKIFEQEADIFMDWVLEGVQRLMKRGRFLIESEWPEEIRRLKENIRYSNDHVGAWMRDCDVSYGSNEPIAKDVVYANFATWCDEEGRVQLEPNVFWREVSRRPGFEGVTQRIQARVGVRRVSVVNITIGSKTI